MLKRLSFYVLLADNAKLDDDLGHHFIHLVILYLKVLVILKSHENPEEMYYDITFKQNIGSLNKKKK